MAARRETGLTAEQVAQLRTDVSAGRTKRVVVSGPQFPAGLTGTIVRIGEPDVDGDDYIAVRVKVGGVVDELGFAPTELSMSGRGHRKSVVGKPPATTPPAQPAAPKRRRAPSRPKPAASGAPPASTPAAATAASPAARPATAAAKQAARSTRRAASATPVTVSIASAGASWTVSARRGQRVVLKSAPVPPGVVAAVAALLGQPPLEEAVAAVNDTARTEAEARAEELRAELAKVEAVLNSHRRP